MKAQLSRVVFTIVDKLILNLARWRYRFPAPHFATAAEPDIFYAYRLFLNRLPDAEGYASFLNLVQNHHVSVDYLANLFLESAELQHLQAERDKPVLVQLPQNYKLYVRLIDHFVGKSIADSRLYEPHVTRALEELLKPEMLFLDIGGNIGFFSMLAGALVGPKGRVLAFEPMPANCELFRQSIAINGFDHVTLYPYAAAEKAQTFSLHNVAKSSNSRMVEVTAADATPLIIEAVRLDDFLTDLPALHVVKMDIEGAEPRAVAGMRGLIQQFKPTIVFEYAPDLIEVTSGSRPVAFLQEIAAMGYTLHHLPHDFHGSLSQLVPAEAEALHALCDQLHALDHIDILAVPHQ